MLVVVEGATVDVVVLGVEVVVDRATVDVGAATPMVVDVETGSSDPPHAPAISASDKRVGMILMTARFESCWLYARRLSIINTVILTPTPL